MMHWESMGAIIAKALIIVKRKCAYWSKKIPPRGGVWCDLPGSTLLGQ